MGRHIIFCFNSVISTFFSTLAAAVLATSTQFYWSKVMHVCLCLFCYCLFHSEYFVFLQQKKWSRAFPGPKPNVLAGAKLVQRAGGGKFEHETSLIVHSLETLKTFVATTLISVLQDFVVDCRYACDGTTRSKRVEAPGRQKTASWIKMFLVMTNAKHWLGCIFRCKVIIWTPTIKLWQ